MDNLYDQLNRLSRFPDAFTEWAEYRTALTGFIISSTIENGSALIVGAGECNDLDLARLAVHFSSVALLDCDAEAMRRALIRYGKEENTIRCIRADLVGIRPDRYRLTADSILTELKKGTSGSAVEELLLKEIGESYRTREPDPLPEPFRWDNVVCCGVHSQLLSMYMRMACVYARYADLNLERIERKLRGYDMELIPSVDAVLAGAAGHRLIIGAETEKVGEEGGIEGALQALNDPQLTMLPVIGRTELIWNLDKKQKKQYRMEIRAYQTA